MVLHPPYHLAWQDTEALLETPLKPTLSSPFPECMTAETAAAEAGRTELHLPVRLLALCLYVVKIAIFFIYGKH